MRTSIELGSDSRSTTTLDERAPSAKVREGCSPNVLSLIREDKITLTQLDKTPMFQDFLMLINNLGLRARKVYDRNCS